MSGLSKKRAGSARELTEFFLREIRFRLCSARSPSVLAIGLAIRYSVESAQREAEVKSPLEM